jgi:3-deoxy-D-manno-octulosonic-acid transferase
MGEFRAAIVLIDALIKAYPNHKILVTSTTPTGSKVVSEQYQRQFFDDKQAFSSLLAIDATP